MSQANLKPWSIGMAGLCLLLMVAQVWAIPPIILHEFTFGSESSRLGVTGGFAGIDELHGLDGTFAIAIGYEQVFDPPGRIALVPFASFVAVDAVLTHPGLLQGADLDGLLNLTGLEGMFADGFDFTGLVFTGVDGQGQPMSVRVSVQDRQLHLEGKNSASCCDMFNYRLNAFADIPYMGDIDKDGHVGIDDLNSVLSQFGKTVTPMMVGDVNWDGYIGIDDLNAVLGDWNAGSADSAPPDSPGPPSSPGSPGFLVIPEPIVLGMILPGIACWMLRRRG